MTVLACGWSGCGERTIIAPSGRRSTTTSGGPKVSFVRAIVSSRSIMRPEDCVGRLDFDPLCGGQAKNPSGLQKPLVQTIDRRRPMIAGDGEVQRVRRP